MKIEGNLTDYLCEQIASELGVDIGGISVAVLNGTVVLRGTVPTYSCKVAAAKSIEHVSGVREVSNNLVVSLAAEDICPDSDIRAAAVNAIDAVTTVPVDSLEITIHNGCVKLEGTVKSHGQKEAVEVAIRHLRGLIHITNLISIQTPIVA